MTDMVESEFSEPYPPMHQEVVLPHSLEAEQAVIGGLMLAGDKIFDQVASLVREGDFYRAEHRLIFSALGRLAEIKEPFDPITICDDLSGRKELDKAGGSTYIADLATTTPSAANIEAYARIVRERATLRQLIEAADALKDRSYNPEGLESKDLVGEAEKRLLDIAEGGPKDDAIKDADTLLKGALDRINELYEAGGDITGVSSGFTDLDEKTSGWQKSDLIIVAGRPSMGKTAFALNMIEHAIFNTDAPVLVFSLEMPSQALMMRLLASVGRIELKKIRDGKLSGDEWDQLSRAATRIKGKKLFIDDTPGLTPTEVRARTRRLAREHGTPAMIMLDYLQLMRVVGAGDNRVQEISEISRSLKQVAREFECPMIALSQLNRGVEQRPNKRPMNSDLRESGAIEQDADVILFLYRDEYYNEDSPDKGIAEIIIGKQRNGEIGTCRLQFEGKYTRFNNLARDYFAGNNQFGGE
jgi:replicative DNA helicase